MELRRMIIAREQPDGSLTDFSPDGCRDRTAEDVELDEMPVGAGPWRRDPQNPRRAILHAALVLVAAVRARRARAIDAETRMVILQRLRNRLLLAGKGVAWVDAQIAAADAEVLDALRDET
jgi:hypothetical protein